MKTYKTIEELKKDVVDNKLIIEDSITIEFNLDYNALNINARDINARDINALNINARDINARDINAWDINAWDINAWDINAWDINARDIKYYGVCFAYKDIRCKSIGATREENSKHFCLDGEIIYKEECKKVKVKFDDKEFEISKESAEALKKQFKEQNNEN